MTPDPRIVSLPAAEIRRRFVEFFAERGHAVVPSASLVPAGDQTLLFTNSGMVQFKEVLTGAETRSYKRAVDYQRVLRVAGKHNDFEEVGRTTRHNTFFEMLGNWSFGDYFKREAIHWAWDFLTRDLGIPAERLAATTYKDDEVARAVWRDEIGLPPERMAIWGDVDAGDDNNFWRMAETGPCGPCSEIHFDRGAHLSEGPECVPDHSEHCPRWLEIWNLVFMEFDQRPSGRVPLPFQSVDTGMSLERLASVLQQVPSNFDTDLFTPIHARLRELLGHDPEAFEAERFSYQVIADHARAITFLIADGVLPSNEGRGYVLRRIVRRAVRHGRLLGRREPFLATLATVVVEIMAEAYPFLREREAEVLAVIGREEAQFARTLDAGSRMLDDEILRLKQEGASEAAAVVLGDDRVIGRRPEDVPADAPVLAGDVAFRLHDTFGFPIDLTIELAAEYGVAVDRAGFDAALAEQRERSRGGKKAELAKHAELASLYEAILRRHGDSKFLGYETTTADGTVVAILRDGMEFDELTGNGEAEIVLDQTPFYAEGGGQVGDQGELREGWRRFSALHGHRYPAAGRGATGRSHRPSRDDPRAPARRRDRDRGGRSGATGPDDAQPHGHASPAPGAAERGRAAGTTGRFARHAGLPPLRLPAGPCGDRGRAPLDRRRGSPHHPRRPDRHAVLHEHGGGRGSRRRRVLRREVRRAGPHDPSGRLLPRALRRHALQLHRSDRWLCHHVRAEHRLRTCAASRPSPAMARTPGSRHGSRRSSRRPRRPAPDPWRRCPSGSPRCRRSSRKRAVV